MRGMISQLHKKILKIASSQGVHKPAYDASMFPALGLLSEDRKRILEQRLRVSISNAPIFEQAVTHRSYLQIAENPEIVSNERLEFLGDAILSVVVAEYLFYLHKDVSEGELTKMRSWLVNKKSLAFCARRLKLEEFLLVSLSARQSLEQGNQSILADALEACIAAIYLDSGSEASKKFILDTILDPIMSERSLMRDSNYKSILLEYAQAGGKGVPRYYVVEESGPDHDRQFIIEVHISAELVGTGVGRNKKEAEQNAAREAIRFLNISV